MKVDFFIVGAPKSGTTSLYYYLSQHSDIEMSRKKETDFFSFNDISKQGLYYKRKSTTTLEEYINLFNQKDGVIYGEASVSYLFYPNVARDIKNYNPDAKIIIILRNPIERAFSHYLMDYRLGLINDSFENIVNKRSNDKKAKLFYQQYIKVGEYAEQLKRYFSVFNKQNILLIDYDDFTNDLSTNVKLVYSFLNVSTDFPVDINKKYNSFSMPKNKWIRMLYSFITLRNFLSFILPEFIIRFIRFVFFRKDKKPRLLQETRDKLKKHFSYDINLLHKIIDKDYSKWIK